MLKCMAVSTAERIVNVTDTATVRATVSGSDDELCNIEKGK
jgi:hypothetical protein